MNTTRTYSVTGMTCGHCVQSVTAKVSKIGGVNNVDVDLPTGAVTVQSDSPIDDEEVAAAVHEAGFQVAT